MSVTCIESTCRRTLPSQATSLQTLWPRRRGSVGSHFFSRVSPLVTQSWWKRGRMPSSRSSPWTRVDECEDPACEQGPRSQGKSTLTLNSATADVRTFYLGQEEDSGARFRLSGQCLSLAAQPEAHEFSVIGIQENRARWGRISVQELLHFDFWYTCEGYWWHGVPGSFSL